MEIITCHLNADFDCLASMLGAKKIYHKAVPIFPGSQEKKVREFLEVHTPFEIGRLRDVDPARVKRVILVDTAETSRLGPLREVAERPGVKIHLYDHHFKHQQRSHKQPHIRTELEVVEEVGATATIFTEIIRQRKVPITPLEATVLALGIYEETGSFRFNSTTERDMLAAAWLVKKGAIMKIIAEYIKIELDRDELRLLNSLLESSRDLELKGVRIRIAKAISHDYLGDVAHLAHRIMDMDDIDALIMMVGMEDKVIMVGRSRVPEVNVGSILEAFGGGGHPVAASATIKDEPLEVIEERLEATLNQHVRPQKRARDIMTSPVITITDYSTLGDAENRMTKFGVNVLPVIKDDNYLGIITREVVEKAIFHGFKRHPVSDFTTTDAETAAPDTPIERVEKQMIEQNQRFMPVIESGRVIGAITRTDLLRNLYEDALRRKRVTTDDTTQKPAISRNLGRLIRERFPSGIVRFLKHAGKTAQELGYGAYLVGGSIRDLLRGEKNLDIDIVIEGDGLEFVRRLSEEIPDLKITTHKRFGTAKIRFGDRSGFEMPSPDFRIDIATARTEYYEEPASLPKVETSSIKKDLYRRDFTINTLAVRLNPDDFGRLLDFFGGQRDIREKTIRVLHNLSFIEDPTRAFRAVRFAERFGFRISKHTENLIKSAVRLNLFEKLSGTRIYDELRLALSETDPVRILRRLSRYGLLKVVHPALRFTDTLEEVMRSVVDSLAWFDLLFLEEEIDRPRILIMGIIYLLEDEQRIDALRRLSTPENTITEIARSYKNASFYNRQLRTEDPVIIYNTLKDSDLETLIFTIAISRDRTVQKAVSRFLLELRKTKPEITGKDLISLGIPPGPVYSEILKNVTEEKLRGNLLTKDDELCFVRERYKGLLNKG